MGRLDLNLLDEVSSIVIVYITIAVFGDRPHLNSPDSDTISP